MSQLRTQQKSMSATFLAVLILGITASSLLTWWCTRSHYQSQGQPRLFRDVAIALATATGIAFAQWLLKQRANWWESQYSREKASYSKTKTLLPNLPLVKTMHT